MAQNQSESLDITRFYQYNDLTEILNGFHSRFPTLTALETAGQSYEGREIWALTITNSDTGGPETKPAMYIDGNIHAGEVTGCNVCLYTIDYLLNNYGSDKTVTHLLDTSTFYILPRVQPDGAERYLTTPETLRSSVRRWPYEEDDEGLYEADIDGDGQILQMRVEDPNGEWKKSEQDDRLLIKRDPDEVTGTFYRLYTEGFLRDWRGEPVKLARSSFGIDQNRNWPANWSPNQRGGGAFPLSEPETRAVAGFVDNHPNIVILQNYHTTGGVILRSPCFRPDREISPRDMEIYQTMGELGEAATGYPCSSVYDSFPLLDDAGRRSTAGGFIEWTYDHRGIFSFATELWDIRSRAGIERPKDDPMRVVRDDSENDGLKLLQWNDRELGGRGFVPWKRFDHPQLGTVEIGGWKNKEVRQNAPAEFLEDECQRNFSFTLKQAAMLPRIEITNVEIEALGNDLNIIRVTLANAGYLPTTGSYLAKGLNLPPVTVEIDGADVLIGRNKIELSHLQGRSSSKGGAFRPGNARVDNERMVEYLVRGSGSITVTASADRAGSDSKTIDLS